MATINMNSDGFGLHDSVVHLLRLSLQRMTDLFARHLGESDLTLRQFMLLLAAQQRPGSTQTDLVTITGIDRSTIGDMLDRLVKRALVHRERSGRDQRANAVTVLPAGVAALQSALPAARAAEAELLAGVPAEHRSNLIAMLQRVAHGLEAAPVARRDASPPVAEPRT